MVIKVASTEHSALTYVLIFTCYQVQQKGEGREMIDVGELRKGTGLRDLIDKVDRYRRVGGIVHTLKHTTHALHRFLTAIK